MSASASALVSVSFAWNCSTNERRWASESSLNRVPSSFTPHPKRDWWQQTTQHNTTQALHFSSVRYNHRLIPLISLVSHQEALAKNASNETRWIRLLFIISIMTSGELLVSQRERKLAQDTRRSIDSLASSCDAREIKAMPLQLLNWVGKVLHLRKRRRFYGRIACQDSPAAK